MLRPHAPALRRPTLWSLPLGAIALCALTAGVSSAQPKSTPTPAPKVDPNLAQIKSIEDSAASEFRALAVKAERWQLHLDAAGAYRDALAYDANLMSARKALGYTKRVTQWVLTKPPLVPADGPRAAKHRAEWRRLRREKVDALAERFRVLARKAEAEGDKRTAWRFWQKTITIAPRDKEALRALSYVPTPLHSAWIWSGDADFVTKAAPGEGVDRAGSAAKRMGFVTWSARQSRNIHLASYLSQKWLAYAMRHGETARTYLQSLFGLRRGNHRTYLLLLRDKKQFRRFLKTSRPKDSPAQIKYALAHLEGAQGSVDAWRAMVADSKSDIGDATIWAVVSKTLAEANRDIAAYPIWKEGITAYLTIRLHGTANYLNVGNKSRDRRLKRLWSDVGSWRLRVRSLIQSGEALSLESLLRSRSFSSFAAADTAQSWSLVDFFVSTRLKAFKVFLNKLRTKGDVAAAYYQAFGETPSRTDRLWKQWVLSRY